MAQRIFEGLSLQAFLSCAVASTPLETMKNDLTTAQRKHASSGYSFQNLLLSSEPANKMVATPGNLRTKGSKRKAKSNDPGRQQPLEEARLVKLKAGTLDPTPLLCPRPASLWTFRAGMENSSAELGEARPQTALLGPYHAFSF